jgi:toluene-4-monooxygenase system protein B
VIVVLVPLYGFLEGDTIGLVVLVHDDDTVGDLAERLVAAAAVRVRRPAAVAVRHRGAVLDPALTIAEAGLTALERVDVIGKGA